MNTEGNLHQGHRRRTLDKFSKNSEVLADHEALEALLFYALPRVDTNPLAHKLLKSFGSLDKLFLASVDELTAIDGVGKKTAEFLKVVGCCLTRANKLCNAPFLGTSEKIYNELVCEFLEQKTESCLVVFLDKNFRKISQLVFECKKKDEVWVDLNLIARAVVAFNPVYAVLAHNHIGEACYPSEKDDRATKSICLLLQIHGVNLIEHMIFAGKAHYSYKTDGKLEEIKNQIKSHKLIDDGGIEE